MCFEYADQSGEQTGFDPFRPVLGHEMSEEVFNVREELRALIENHGELEDATGRMIPLSAWTGVKKKKNRWRGVLAYVVASYEQELMAALFDRAIEEEKRDGRRRFWIWLYQADGVTLRFSSRANQKKIISNLQKRVSERARELSMITKLEVDHRGEAK
jgi:hypothetical protein